MDALETSIRELRHALTADPAAPEWRWQVRRGLSAVREALAQPPARHVDGWLSARSGSAQRRRMTLQSRVGALAAGVLDRLDPDSVRGELVRLLADLEHLSQRLNDLVYDSVSLELGGSE